MTRDEGNYLPSCKRLPSQESLLKYDADVVFHSVLAGRTVIGQR